jgi:hypothetical protein
MQYLTLTSFSRKRTGGGAHSGDDGSTITSAIVLEGVLLLFQILNVFFLIFA